MSNNYLIYKFTSISGKSYIGQTKDIIKRFRQHKHKSSGCAAFSSAIKKYGWDSFNYEILASGLTIHAANHFEIFYIKQHNTLHPNGYNLLSGGINFKPRKETAIKISELKKGNKNMLGKKHTEETKLKMSLSSMGNTYNIGRKHSKETILKMCKSQKGRIVSEETRRKLSAIQKGRPSPTKGKVMSDEAKKRLSKINTGKKHSPETLKKMSESMSLVKRTDEWKENISKAKLISSYRHSEETKNKIGKASKERKVSEETKEKQSASLKGRVLKPESIQKMISTKNTIRKNNELFIDLCFLSFLHTLGINIDSLLGTHTRSAS